MQCQLDLLSKLRTPGAVRKALSSLPPTLDKTYESLIERIDGEEDKTLAGKILQILAFSLRPLSLLELCIMLQITPGMHTLDESKCLTQPKDVLDICGGLLKYNEKSQMVTLAHHSVKVFLTSTSRKELPQFRFDAPAAHRTISLLCLTYLSFDVFRPLRKESRSKLCEEYPLLNYATFQWAVHMNEVTDTDDLLWNALRYFLLSTDDGRQNFVNWVRLLIPASRNAKSTQPLYYASSYGLTTIVEYLLSLGVNTEIHGGRGGATPINIAAFRGRLEVVKLLYRHGADPLKRDKMMSLNAIQWAHHKRQWEMVEFFEKEGYHIGKYTHKGRNHESHHRGSDAD